MKVFRILAVVVLTALATAALGWAARAPLVLPGNDQGLLRLSWRLRGERIEHCRARTPEELAKLPVHMRTPEECVSRLVAYRLRVQVDDSVLESARVLPGGMRGDRPVFVLRDYPLTPGRHRVRIAFVREEVRATRGVAALAFDASVQARPGSIELITLDGGGTGLVHRHSPGR